MSKIRDSSLRPIHSGSSNHVGAWRSLVARFVRDEEAVGSNPAAPTKKASQPGGFLVDWMKKQRSELSSHQLAEFAI